MTDRINYPRLQATARRLIDRTGQPALLRKRTASSGGDPWNPTTPGAVTDVSVVATIVEYELSERDGTSVAMTDQQALIAVPASEDLDPKSFDELVVGGRAHGIRTMNILNPGGTELLYTAQVSM